MLDLLCRREIPPAGRQIGNARHVTEGNDAAVLGADAELALRLRRGACHDSPSMWQAISASPRAGVRKEGRGPCIRATRISTS
jgi:hypothetical protein